MTQSNHPQIELIPAIDLIDGKIVRLTQGDYATQKTYGDCPADFARQIESYGFRRLHIVDLEGAKSDHIVNRKTLEQIAHATNLIIDFGGGIKSENAVHEAFDAGAHFVTLGSIAVRNTPLTKNIISTFGADRIILGADVLDRQIRINGWQENSCIDLFDFINSYMSEGISNILCTDIGKDGMLQGSSVGLYQDIMSRHPHCHLIASGGIGSMQDIQNLEEAGIPAVVFGKAIYENKISLKELAQWAGLNA